jgi:hypothetical protein
MMNPRTSLTLKNAALVFLAMAITFLFAGTGNSIADAKDKGLDYSLPNTGLKNPTDITWPYADQYSYEVNLNGPFSPFEKPTKEIFSSEYLPEADGGIFIEQYELRTAFMIAETAAEIEFDEHRLIKSIENNLGIKFVGSGYTADEGFEAVHTFDNGKLHIEAGFFGANLPEDALKAEVRLPAPDDGCYLFGGSDLPGTLAFLLSAIDLDGEEPVEVWTYNGGDWILGYPTVGIFRFMRLGIYPYESASADTREWWEDIREDYDDWQPADDVRIVILENLGDSVSFFNEGDEMTPEVEDMLPVYPEIGPFAAAYIDGKGRLIRIEQPSGLLGDLSVLDKIGAGGSWWGDKGE